MDEIRDVDPIETQEWIDAIEGVIEVEGSERAHFLLDLLHLGTSAVIGPMKGSLRPLKVGC